MRQHLFRWLLIEHDLLQQDNGASRDGMNRFVARVPYSTLITLNLRSNREGRNSKTGDHSIHCACIPSDFCMLPKDRNQGLGVFLEDTRRFLLIHQHRFQGKQVHTESGVNTESLFPILYFKGEVPTYRLNISAKSDRSLKPTAKPTSVTEAHGFFKSFFASLIRWRIKNARNVIACSLLKIRLN